MRQSQQYKAFTLLEVLMSVLIILTLSALLLVAPSGTNERIELKNSAQKITADIQRTQGLALATADFGMDIPGGGWGLYFEDDKRCYVIFADDDDDQVYDGPMGADFCNTSIVNGELFERTFLPATISFTQGSFVANGSSVVSTPQVLTLTFRQPRPTIFVNTAQDGTLELQIEALASGNTQTITVNEVGNVEVQ